MFHAGVVAVTVASLISQVGIFYTTVYTFTYIPPMNIAVSVLVAKGSSVKTHRSAAHTRLFPTLGMVFTI